MADRGSLTGRTEVTLRKNATAKEAQAACEVSVSMDDFLWMYSGKASSSDMIKLFYAGRVSISGYAFRKVSNFAQSFDFSSDQWRKFYKWRDEMENMQRSPSAIEEARNVGSPSRDYWFFHCRKVLEKYNISKLQRMQWEASLASLFGDNYVLQSVCRSAQKSSRAPVVRGSSAEFLRAASSVLGLHPLAISRRKRSSSEGAMVVGQQSYLQRELAVFFDPSCSQKTDLIASVAQGNRREISGVFGFFNEEYVSAVKESSKERFHRRHMRNRIDLGDAGLAQLDKLVRVIGRGGHLNTKNNTQSKYVPAPEILLREFRVSATVVMDTLREKASGRKALHNIPAPDVDFFLGGRPGSSLLVVDDTTAGRARADTGDSTKLAASTGGLLSSVVVEVNREQVSRSRRRNLAVPKQRLKAKLASLSRDLAQKNSSVVANVEEHLAFSDYL